MGNTNEKKKKDSPPEAVNVTPVSTGLYQKCTWDQRILRRLILEKKLAPIVSGQPDKTALELEECPICFLYYPTGLNRAVCCKQGLCTECYTQIKSTPQQILDCPFCSHSNFVVVYLGPPNREEKEKEALEEQRVVEIQKKRKEEEERDKINQRSASLPSMGPDRMKTFDEVAQDISSGKVVYTPPTSSSLPPPPPIFTNQSKHKHGGKSGNSRSGRSTTWAGRNRAQDEGWKNDQDVEMLEELMLMEAIRLSLSESGGAGAQPNTSAEPNEQKENSSSTSNTASTSTSTSTTTTTTTTAKASQTKNDQQESKGNARNSLGELFFFEDEQRSNLFVDEEENEDLWGDKAKGEKRGEKANGEKSEKWADFDEEKRGEGEKQKDDLFGDVDDEQEFFKFIPSKTSTSTTTTSKTQSSPSLTTSTTSTFSEFPTTTTTSNTGAIRSMSLSPSTSSSTSSSAPSSSPASPSTSPPCVSSIKQGMTEKKEFNKTVNTTSNTNLNTTTNNGAVAVAVDLDDGAVCQEAN
eukprot:TRINITY_DN3514_c0_g1_i1.p1 TRINITY_DN3514_c0_g1~~TRINITY_DN3514_c0_g1_i1.p1  ORF type:complete len:523 (-),score=168.70 TRINITY_DN3514_c0_g1_i1:302-1870(-)